jgi:hypothetical protein
MRLLILCAGLLIAGLGFLSLRILPKDQAFAFFQGALTLGGGWIICYGFCLRMHWHGIIGAGVLALLGLSKGIGNLPHLFSSSSHGPTTSLELIATLVSIVVLTRTLWVLKNERNHRLRATIDHDPDPPA